MSLHVAHVIKHPVMSHQTCKQGSVQVLRGHGLHKQVVKASTPGPAMHTLHPRTWMVVPAFAGSMPAMARPNGSTVPVTTANTTMPKESAGDGNGVHQAAVSDVHAGKPSRCAQPSNVAGSSAFR